MQGCRYTERTVLHRLTNDVSHSLQFGGRRGALLAAVSGFKDQARSHIGADIRRYAALKNRSPVVAESRKTLCRGGRGTFSEDHRRNALPDHTLGIAVRENGLVRVIMHVDEARR